MTHYFNDFGSGKPVVLLHAFPLSKEMWKPQIEVLAENGFRLILPDLPGFGEHLPLEENYTIDDMARLIANLLEKLRIEKAIIGGLSMGGYVALNLYREFPGLFAGMILADTTHLSDTDEKRAARFELMSLIKSQGASILKEKMLPNLISEDTKLNNPKLVSGLEHIFSNLDSRGAINALLGMAERRDNSELLEKISIPTLLMFGESDKVTNIENARLMQRKIINAELAVIKKAGHLSNLEQPESFNEALLKFCSDIQF